MTNESPTDVDRSRSFPGADNGIDPSEPPVSRLRRLTARLLRVPLFYKILWANAAAVALVAGVGTWLTATHGFGRSGGAGPLEAALLIAAAGGLASAGVHVFLLRRALSPLRELARVAGRLREEGPEADLRARIPSTADRNLADLIRVFNGMLDTLAENRSRLRGLTARTLEVTEEERKRIAHRLQEDTAQRLAALMVRLQVARRAEDDEQRNAALEEMREEVAQALESIRRTARVLHPPELADIGLERAVRAYTRRLTEAAGSGAPRMEFDLEPADEGLEPSVRVALYRILQEALRNAHQHADATFVRVQVHRDGEHLRAVVADDGRGLPRDRSWRDGDGYGLLAMRERAIHAGGRLAVVSRAGEGTSVHVELPLREPGDPSGSDPAEEPASAAARDTTSP